MADVKSRSADRSAASRTPARRREPPSRRRAAEEVAAAARLPLGPRNWQLIGAGLGVAALGFVVLSRGSITLAPFLLVLGYCVLIPAGILLPPRQAGPSADQPAAPGE